MSTTACAVGRPVSGELQSIGHGSFGLHQHHRSVLLRKPGDQTARLKGADLLGWKVHHGHHLTPHERLAIVEVRDLCARFEYPDIGTKIDVQDVGGFSSTLKCFRTDDGAHPQVHFFEILP